MKCTITKYQNLSGEGASIYVIKHGGAELSTFSSFINENKDLYLSEIRNIVKHIKAFGEDGFREDFFKFKEGNRLGDGIMALFDQPKSKLRLYCILLGKSILIVGGGGPKSKKIRALQEDEKLKKENYELRRISAIIDKRIRAGEIRYSIDKKEILGNLSIKE